jgi:hypothetical protein
VKYLGNIERGLEGGLERYGTTEIFPAREEVSRENGRSQTRNL